MAESKDCKAESPLAKKGGGFSYWNGANGAPSETSEENNSYQDEEAKSEDKYVAAMMMRRGAGRRRGSNAESSVGILDSIEEVRGQKEGGHLDLSRASRTSEYNGQFSANDVVVGDDGDDSEMEDDDAAEREWNIRKTLPEVGEIIVSSDPEAADIVRGFRIVTMTMRDADTGQLVWEEDEWGDDMFECEMEAHLPASILELKAVSREIVFYSAKCINDFRLTQKLIFGGVAIEEWEFRFGFVIAGSRNSWQQQIEAAAQMLEPEALSGNLVIETSFYDGATFLCKNLVRIHYV